MNVSRAHTYYGSGATGAAATASTGVAIRPCVGMGFRSLGSFGKGGRLRAP